MNFNSLFQAFLAQFTPFAIFLALFSFLYASLGRAKIFHFESRARLVLSGVLALYSTNLVLNSGWNQILAVTATAATIGLTALIMYHVGLQRGKTLREAVEVIEDYESPSEWPRRKTYELSLIHI